MAFHGRTDKDTLQRLLASGTLTTVEAADIQRSYDLVVAGEGLLSHQRQRANVLYDRYLGEECVRVGRSRLQLTNAALAAKLDAMPRPKRPPGK